MLKPYSQLRAMFAITRAGLLSIFRSPSAVGFSFAFPLVFILVFGFLGSGNRISLRTAVTEDSDTSGYIYNAIRSQPGIIMVKKPLQELKEELEKGRLTALITIKKNSEPGYPAYHIHLTSAEAVNPQHVEMLRSVIRSQVEHINRQQFPDMPTVASISEQIDIIPGRTYSTIDFILPGQLGFSLLSAGVFGVAFLFYHLRQTLVLKRFFATPISRMYIILGEGLSRVIFQLITAIVILAIGYFFFNFTLVHGWLTFAELLILSFLGLLVFMSFGFVVSGLAKTDSAIPPLANIVTLPQFLLAGTFFPVDNFPEWLQPVCNILPLTHLNDAMRNVAFEGAHITDCYPQLAVLTVWGIIGYLLAVKLFKWE